MTQGNVSTCADVSEAMEEWLVPLWHFYAQDRLTESYKNDPSQYLTNYHKQYVCVFDNVSKPDQKRLLLNKGDLAAQLCDTLSCFTYFFSLLLIFLNVLGHLFSGFVTVDFKASCCCPVQILCVTGGSFLSLYFYTHTYTHVHIHMHCRPELGLTRQRCMQESYSVTLDIRCS